MRARLYFAFIFVAGVTTTTRYVHTPAIYSKFRQAEMEIALIWTATRLSDRNEGGLLDDLIELTQPANYLKNVGKGEAPVDPWGRPYLYRKGVDDYYGFLVWSEAEKEGDDRDDIRWEWTRRRARR